MKKNSRDSSIRIEQTFIIQWFEWWIIILWNETFVQKLAKISEHIFDYLLIANFNIKFFYKYPIYVHVANDRLI